MRKRKVLTCNPCKTGKRGPASCGIASANGQCTEDPDDPGGVCFECKNRNRGHKCITTAQTDPTPKRRRVDKSAKNPRASESIEGLITEVQSLKSMVVNLTELVSKPNESKFVIVNVDLRMIRIP